MTQQKKPTKGDIERRIRNAVVFVPKEKGTLSIYFDDKGLRLTITDDFAVIATMFHRHVFNAFTAAGVSLPYLYTKRFVEIALANENGILVKDEKGNTRRSYAKLFATLNTKEDKSEYNIAWYYDLWLSNIFSPLYGIGDSKSDAFIVYEQYLHNVARNQTVLSEKPQGMTNKKFIKEIMELVEKYTEGMAEDVIFAPMTDEEKAKAEVVALSEQQQEKTMEDNANGNHE